MNFHPLIVVLCIALPGLPLAVPADAQTQREGTLFDYGVSMQAPAEGAPEELSGIAAYCGAWNVEVHYAPNEEEEISGSGHAIVTYINRGHAIMERFYPAAEGNTRPAGTLQLLTYNRANKQWLMGLVNGAAENIHIFNGSMHKQGLVLQTAVRRLGGALVTMYRVRYSPFSARGFTYTVEESTDYGEHWRSVLRKRYTPRPAAAEQAREWHYGVPAPGMPPEARQFDFLIGRWIGRHDLTMPNGQRVQFPDTSTAVYCLDGRAILEHSWYNVDPSLPDAATTIVRIYNRAMRRWESLYASNRNHGLLHFGGVMENGRIILHQFGAGLDDAPLPYYNFHDMAQDTYRWHAESSNDRGQTFQTTWTIDFTRLK